MADPKLLIAIILIIAFFSIHFYWTFLKQTAGERVLSMVADVVIVLFFSYGLYIQNPVVAIFHK